ncbi:unnamed protein product [Owenia fusiformis]|uniref:Uncharacterized protein n=1 Tax=Owenia fusiformis TaxID=6347 RepID=A0A8J1XTZ8_OWEFU|nr:unnamed protein product [Owenia fusiformis]
MATTESPITMDNLPEVTTDPPRLLIKNLKSVYDTVFKCLHCEFDTKHLPTMEDHVYVHLNVLPYYCDLCSIGFKTRFAAHRHSRKTHGTKQKPQLRHSWIDKTKHYSKTHVRLGVYKPSNKGTTSRSKSQGKASHGISLSPNSPGSQSVRSPDSSQSFPASPMDINSMPPTPTEPLASPGSGQGMLLSVSEPASPATGIYRHMIGSPDQIQSQHSPLPPTADPAPSPSSVPPIEQSHLAIAQCQLCEYRTNGATLDAIESHVSQHIRLSYKCYWCTFVGENEDMCIEHHNESHSELPLKLEPVSSNLTQYYTIWSIPRSNSRSHSRAPSPQSQIKSESFTQGNDYYSQGSDPYSSKSDAQGSKGSMGPQHHAPLDLCRQDDQVNANMIQVIEQKFNNTTKHLLLKYMQEKHKGSYDDLWNKSLNQSGAGSRGESGIQRGEGIQSGVGHSQNLNAVKTEPTDNKNCTYDIPLTSAQTSNAPVSPMSPPSSQGIFSKLLRRHVFTPQTSEVTNEATTVNNMMSSSGSISVSSNYDTPIYAPVGSNEDINHSVGYKVPLTTHYSEPYLSNSNTETYTNSEVSVSQGGYSKPQGNRVPTSDSDRMIGYSQLRRQLMLSQSQLGNTQGGHLYSNADSNMNPTLTGYNSSTLQVQIKEEPDSYSGSSSGTRVYHCQLCNVTATHPMLISEHVKAVHPEANMSNCN